jgi:C-terminal processing protease CtpA/Prc
MAGRFFARPRPHGPYTLMPTGDWQHEGPVVMITDELQVSSAETFTWAMSESGRAVSVGRPTGGATLVPRSFTVPSKIFSFRLGCTDRRTPEKGVQPEGVGTPPDVLVPVTAALLKKHRDPDLAVALRVLRLLMDGKSREEAIDAALE